MAPAWLLPFLAGAISMVFASRVWGQWHVRRRPHQLAWAIGLTLYALASFIEAYVAEAPWTAGLYRAYFPMAASTVGFLGLGTILLARQDVWTAAFAAFVGVATVVAIMGPLTVPLDMDAALTIERATGEEETRPLHQWGTELGGKAVPFPNPGRLAFLLLNIVGGLALIGGAFLSWRKTRRSGVLLIGVGALLPFLGGGLSTALQMDLRILLQAVGIAVMFAGYLQGREVRPVAPAADAEPAQA